MHLKILAAVGRLALAAFGIGAVGWLLRAVGMDSVMEAARRAAPWLPFLLSIEGGRIAAEALAARSLLAEEREKVPIGALIRTHLVAYSVSIVTPAGRPAAEATKAGLLRRYIGGPKAAALASTNQVLNLIGEACLSSAALGVACFHAESSVLKLGLFGHIVVCVCGATLLRFALVSRRLQVWLARFRKLESIAPEFRRELEAQRLLKPALWFIAGKSLHMLLLGALFYAVGAVVRPHTVFLAQGLNAVASVVGDFVPAQLGTTDGVFAAGAGTLGVGVTSALSAALLLHTVQLVWVAVGVLTPLAAGLRREDDSSASFVRREQLLEDVPAAP